MASSTFCSASSATVVTFSSVGSRPSRALCHPGNEVSFRMSTSRLTGLRSSIPSKRPSLEQSFKRLSIKADGTGEVALVPPVSPPVPSPSPSLKRKSKVAVLQRKQRVLLRFLWLEKNIGIALDQVFAGHGSVPLSPYFFWPRKDAWEESKAKLDSKKFFSTLPQTKPQTSLTYGIVLTRCREIKGKRVIGGQQRTQSTSHGRSIGNMPGPLIIMFQDFVRSLSTWSYWLLAGTL